MTENKPNDPEQQSEENSGISTEENSRDTDAHPEMVPETEPQNDANPEIVAGDGSADQPDLTMEEQDAATPAEMRAVEDFDLNLLLDIPLEITVELGRARIQIQELLNLGPGSTVTLSKLEGEPVDILANDKLIARGEVVLQQKKYGIRITEITSRMDRIKSLN
jgi:flagellar motor switch protein FliN/FliY